MRKLGLAIVATVGLAACVPVETTIVASTLGVSLMGFQGGGKLPHDQLFSTLTESDCSMIKFEKTGRYCDPIIMVDRSDTYCYRTLAGVDCHRIPDPYQNGQQALASPPPNRVRQ